MKKHGILIIYDWQRSAMKRSQPVILQ